MSAFRPYQKTYRVRPIESRPERTPGGVLIGRHPEQDSKRPVRLTFIQRVIVSLTKGGK